MACAVPSATGWVMIRDFTHVTVRGIDLPSATTLLLDSPSSLTLTDAGAPAALGGLTINEYRASLTTPRPSSPAAALDLDETLNGDLVTKA